MIHSVDGYSNKPTLVLLDRGGLTKLAQQARRIHPALTHLEPARVPTRSLRRRLSPQIIEELVTRYKTGDSLRALGREYGVSRSGLSELLQDGGVSLWEQGIDPGASERAVRRYESGLTIRDVVDQVGYSYGTIMTVLHKHGIALRAGAQRRKRGR